MTPSLRNSLRLAPWLSESAQGQSRDSKEKEKALKKLEEVQRAKEVAREALRVDTSAAKEGEARRVC
jgi:hypothetical protein